MRCQCYLLAGWLLLLLAMAMAEEEEDNNLLVASSFLSLGVFFSSSVSLCRWRMMRSMLIQI